MDGILDYITGKKEAKLPEVVVEHRIAFDTKSVLYTFLALALAAGAVSFINKKI